MAMGKRADIQRLRTIANAIEFQYGDDNPNAVELREIANRFAGNKRQPLPAPPGAERFNQITDWLADAKEGEQCPEPAGAEDGVGV